MSEQRDERELAGQKNRQAFVLLLQKYPQITISQSSFDKWRACEVTPGYIRGLEHLGILDCVATDGLQGLFVNLLNEPMVGHVGHFDWLEPKVSFVPYIKKSGEVGYFKSEKMQGAPGSLHKMEKGHVVKPEKPRKKEKSARQKLLDSL
jgi:hypothetical protein